MKTKYEIREVTKDIALDMIKKYHYSNTLPKINKYYIGFFLDKELVGVVTLGWGTRPRHTIQRLFPSLDTKDYYEIGRMCMTDEMPKNSESQMLGQLVKWIKHNLPEVKILFTWADGMLGKCGYVYQASNFVYAGYSDTDIYLLDGYKIHPRQTKILFGLPDDKRVTVRPTTEQMRQYNIQHLRGHQYRYLYFLCPKAESNMLKNECTVSLTNPNPKDTDLVWRLKNNDTGKWEASGKPPYKSDCDADGIKNLLKSGYTNIPKT